MPCMETAGPNKVGFVNWDLKKKLLFICMNFPIEKKPRDGTRLTFHLTILRETPTEVTN